MTGTTLFRNTQEYQSYQASHTIFKEGDSAEEMYVVIQGQVDILIHGEIIDTIGPDGILGEMALIDDHIRSATAVAKTECKLVPINKKSRLRDAVLRSGRHEGYGGSTPPQDSLGSFAGPGNQ
jgi:CRP/FNR family cyclic AMP-dependent transcriptional regulator